MADKCLGRYAYERGCTCELDSEWQTGDCVECSQFGCDLDHCDSCTEYDCDFNNTEKERLKNV